jgi:hypothetical protein
MVDHVIVGGGGDFLSMKAANRIDRHDTVLPAVAQKERIAEVGFEYSTTPNRRTAANPRAQTGRNTDMEL